MENLPFPDEIILKILGYLSGFDLAKCAQVSKGLNRICEDRKLQHYHEWKIRKLKIRKLLTEYHKHLDAMRRNLEKAQKQKQLY